MEFEQQKVKSYDHWTLFLHENQCYLGRTYLWANRSDAVDFIETSKAEREEFYTITRCLKKVLDDLFMPDLYNYASLGNISNHLHVHIIPRYKGTRNFNGLEFADKRWGMNYSPYDQSFDMGNARFHDLNIILQSNLETLDKQGVL